MSINIFFVLLAAIITLIFSGNMQLACMSSLMVVIVLGLYNFVRQFIFACISNEFSFFKARRTEKILILLFLITIIIALLNSLMPAIHERFGQYRLKHAMRNIPDTAIKSAINDLEKHPNDPQYCSLLFFPSLHDRKASTLLRYLTYYHFEKKYCSDFWQFGQNNCGYLEDLNSNIGHPVDLEQNIAVCKFAQSSSFQLHLYKLGF